MSQPRNNLDALHRQLSATKTGVASAPTPSGSSHPQKRAKFKPSNASALPVGSNHPISRIASSDGLETAQKDRGTRPVAQSQGTVTPRLTSMPEATKSRSLHLSQLPHPPSSTINATAIPTVVPTSSTGPSFHGPFRKRHSDEASLSTTEPKRQRTGGRNESPVPRTADKGKARAVSVDEPMPQPLTTVNVPPNTVHRDDVNPAHNVHVDDDLSSKTLSELLDLKLINFDYATDFNRKKMLFQHQLSEDKHDLYVLDAIIQVVQDRARALDSAIALRKSGSIPTPEPETPALPTAPPAISIPEPVLEIPTPSETPPAGSQTYDPNQSQRLDSAIDLEEDHYRSDEPLEEHQPEVYEIDSDVELWNAIETSTSMTESHRRTEPGSDIEVLSRSSSKILVAMGSEPAPSHHPTSVAMLDPTKSSFYRTVMRSLNETFGLQSFRRNQLEAIITTLEGGDALVLMPTGGGKSLCFQLPAACEDGLTVVISPLIALMKDQVSEVNALNKSNLSAVLYEQNQSYEERTQVSQSLRGPDRDRPKLLYVTPERLGNSGALKTILHDLSERKKLKRFVIDEAHVIGSWGRGFRKSYAVVNTLKDDYPSVPILALTATATPAAQEDIKNSLKLHDCLVLTQSFNRANLVYRVESKNASSKKAIVEFIKSKYANASGIIYCLARDQCEKLAIELNNSDIYAAHYHAQVDPEEKERVSSEWKSGRIKIIVATIAFGMGINKPDVRFVIHYDMPKSIAGYLQETGRAGRDGAVSECILYFGFADAQKQIRMIRQDDDTDPEEKRRQEEEVRDVIEFALNDTDCRRIQLLLRFDQRFTVHECAKTCDNCQNEDDVTEEDLSAPAASLVRLVRDCTHDRLSRTLLTNALRGGKARDVTDRGMHLLQDYAAGKKLDPKLIERILAALMIREAIEPYLQGTGGQFPSTYLRLGPKHQEWLQGRGKLTLKVRTKQLEPAAQRRKRATTRQKVARNELPEDPIEDADGGEQVASSRGIARTLSLYQDEEDQPEAGPSQPQPQTQSTTNNDDEECYRELRKVVESQTSSQGEVADLDSCLQLLSLTLPSDGAALQTALRDAFEFDEELSDHVYRTYSTFFLPICTKYAIRAAQLRTSAATGANLPTCNLNQQLTAAELHSRYDYHGRP